MSLSGGEAWSRGFVFSAGILASTASLVGATKQRGFLRDPDGRLVTSAGPGSFSQGFQRDANGALVVSGGVSTPKLYPFA